MSGNRTYRTDREDGRFKSTMGFTNHLMKSHRPKLAFDPQIARPEFEAWQSAVRSKLRELMCLPENIDQPAPRQLSSETREGYRLERWEAYPEPSSVVPYLVLVPDSVDESSLGPAVLCFPGSASSKELLAGEPELRPEQPENTHPVANRMGLHFVREGLISVIIENPGTAELDELPLSGQHPNSGRTKFSAELMMLGRHYVGLSVFQKMHILEWVRELPIVDPTRIGLSGHSLGTEPAMVMAVLDPKISALVFNDFLGSVRLRYAITGKPEKVWGHNNPLWHVIPGLLNWFDFPDLLAAIGPRPLIVTEGGAAEHLEYVGKAYDCLDARGNYEYHYYSKYSDPSNRRHDFQAFPYGLNQEEWFEYVNVDVVNHNFKVDVAVPWLVRQLQIASS